MTTDAKRLQDQMQAGKFAHTDPHRGTCDDCGARLTVPNILESTRSGFTDRRESDETAESVSGGQGLRGALEALAETANRLRAVLADHPADAPVDTPTREQMEALIERSSLGTPEAKSIRDSVPREAVDRIMARVRELDAEAPEPSGDVVERAAQVIYQREYRTAVSEAYSQDSPGVRFAWSHARTLARTLADAGLLIPDDWSQRAERVEHYVADLQARLEGQRDEARARVAELEAEVELLTEHKRQMGIELSESVPRYQLDAAEARARRAEERVREYAVAAAGTLAEHERLTQALRDIRDRVGTSTVAWHIADRALFAADQASDTTPSAACTTCGQPPDAPACSKSLDGSISGHTFAGGTKASDAGEGGE